MWRRVLERLLTGAAVALMAGWFVASIAISVWLAQATGVEVRRKGTLGVATMIFLVPIGIFVAIDEFIVRPLKYGPPAPGRRKRGASDSELLDDLDGRLKPQRPEA